jgi:hypothetical protein
MSFVHFTKVNHHHQLVMFRCALFVNETAKILYMVVENMA